MVNVSADFLPEHLLAARDLFHNSHDGLEPAIYISMREAAALVGISERSLYRLADNEPTLPILRLGGRVLVHRERFIHWLADHEQGRRRPGKASRDPVSLGA